MKTTTRPDVYSIVNDRIIQALEKGTVPWRMPWKQTGGLPQNLISKKPYRGINTFLLHSQGYANAFWLSFNQAKEMGGSVRKGEKGTPITFWTQWTPKAQKALPKDEQKPCLLLRYYTVFNALQCDGIEDRLPAAPETLDFQPIEACETIAAGMPLRPEIEDDMQRACYFPCRDIVQMPSRGSFESEESFYGVLFHELSHATGHQSRLGRFGPEEAIAAFGSQSYAKEELVAEFASAFLCGTARIDSPLLENSAAYIQGWLRKIKEDKKALVSAASQAQKAADYILNQEAA